jgi:uncharacterized protein YyaL (SSP411 family)
VAVVGPTGPERDELERAARARAGSVVVVGEPDSGIPLLAGRVPVDGRPSAYVCRGFVCERPVTTVETLTAALSQTR